MKQDILEGKKGVPRMECSESNLANGNRVARRIRVRTKSDRPRWLTGASHVPVVSQGKRSAKPKVAGFGAQARLEPNGERGIG